MIRQHMSHQLFSSVLKLDVKTQMTNGLKTSVQKTSETFTICDTIVILAKLNQHFCLLKYVGIYHFKCIKQALSHGALMTTGWPQSVISVQLHLNFIFKNNKRKCMQYKPSLLKPVYYYSLNSTVHKERREISKNSYRSHLLARSFVFY